jgi:hypothetical protein
VPTEETPDEAIKKSSQTPTEEKPEEGTVKQDKVTKKPSEPPTPVACENTTSSSSKRNSRRSSYASSNGDGVSTEGSMSKEKLLVGKISFVNSSGTEPTPDNDTKKATVEPPQGVKKSPSNKPIILKRGPLEYKISMKELKQRFMEEPIEKVSKPSTTSVPAVDVKPTSDELVILCVKKNIDTKTYTVVKDWKGSLVPRSAGSNIRLKSVKKVIPELGGEPECIDLEPDSPPSSPVQSTSSAPVPSTPEPVPGSSAPDTSLSAPVPSSSTPVPSSSEPVPSVMSAPVQSSSPAPVTTSLSTPGGSSSSAPDPTSSTPVASLSEPVASSSKNADVPKSSKLPASKVENLSKFMETKLLDIVKSSLATSERQNSDTAISSVESDKPLEKLVSGDANSDQTTVESAATNIAENSTEKATEETELQKQEAAAAKLLREIPSLVVNKILKSKSEEGKKEGEIATTTTEEGEITTKKGKSTTTNKEGESTTTKEGKSATTKEGKRATTTKEGERKTKKGKSTTTIIEGEIATTKEGKSATTTTTEEGKITTKKGKSTTTTNEGESTTTKEDKSATTANKADKKLPKSRSSSSEVAPKKLKKQKSEEKAELIKAALKRKEEKKAKREQASRRDSSDSTEVPEKRVLRARPEKKLGRKKKTATRETRSSLSQAKNTPKRERKIPSRFLVFDEVGGKRQRASSESGKEDLTDSSKKQKAKKRKTADDSTGKKKSAVTEALSAVLSKNSKEDSGKDKKVQSSKKKDAAAVLLDKVQAEYAVSALYNYRHSEDEQPPAEQDPELVVMDKLPMKPPVAKGVGRKRKRLKLVLNKKTRMWSQDKLNFYQNRRKRGKKIGTLAERELRRLGHVIINMNGKPSASAVKETEDSESSCRKDFCKLGCVCISLQVPMREEFHCGKAECIFQCICVKAGASNCFFDCRVQDKTRNLAPEQKEFTNTVISTGAENLVVAERGKRERKVPQRLQVMIFFLISFNSHE